MDDHDIDLLDNLEIQLEPEEDEVVAPESGLPSLPAKPEGPPPKVLVVFPLKRAVAFPGMPLNVRTENEEETKILENARAQGRYIGMLYSTSEPGEGFELEDFAQVGVLAEVDRRLRVPDTGPDGNQITHTQYICRGLRRFRVQKFLRVKKVPVARVEYPEDIYPPGEETEALVRNVQALLQKLVAPMPGGDQLHLAAVNLEPSGNLADFVAHWLVKEVVDKQRVLDEFDVRERLRQVDIALTQEVVRMEIGERIQNEIREKIEKQQKEFFLREQIKIIRRELGEEQDPQERDQELFLKRIEDEDFPEEVAEKVRQEVERLASVPPMSPEYPVVRNYLEWLTELPWKISSEDRYDIDAAQRILEKDHYGLSEAKERILEFLGVRKLRPDHSGPILCFTGPPGVGKTSLGMAIAQATGRKFERMSLGGMRDESEIKGHRRTYIGAMPGRILQMMRRAGTNNPVIVLDEIDKIGKDFRGDPASALLEVLDPAQNHAFLDFYMDVPMDLSKVMFIATCNVLYQVPDALRDRMEVIELPGYVTAEKVQIARRHLLPRQLETHGLPARKLKLPVATLRSLVNQYTREAGVRGLDKAVASLCRKRTLEIARGKRPKPEVRPDRLEGYLGPAKYMDDRLRLRPEMGVALGLAWTAYGGDVLEIECVRFRGKGRVIYTGSLGEVMTESCRIAHAFLRANREAFDLSEEQLAESDLHIHFPAGAVKKDGPSAGITITTALISRLSRKRLAPRLGMTGEITLTGEVLPVGGIREKVLTAKRRGIRRVILPSQNERDVKILDPAWTSGLHFVYVERYEQVFAEAFPKRAKRRG